MHSSFFTTFVRTHPKNTLYERIKYSLRSNLYTYTLVQNKCSRARIHAHTHCKYVNVLGARYTLHHQIQLDISLIVNTPQGIRSVMWRAWLFSGAHSPYIQLQFIRCAHNSIIAKSRTNTQIYSTIDYNFIYWIPNVHDFRSKMHRMPEHGHEAEQMRA